MNARIIVLLLIVAVAGFFIGQGSNRGSNPSEHTSAEMAEEIWTCSMHPQIQMPVPGDCPICGMDLIPLVADNSSGGGETTLELSQSASDRARVHTVEVRRQEASVELRLSGRVAIDETQRANITARVGGRLERLYADVPGTRIRRGDHLVKLYSPELITAQQELIQAAAASQRGGDLMAEMNQQTATSAREKLRLLGLTRRQIEGIEQRGETLEAVTIYSPIDGVVLEKRAVEGEYVKTGDIIYELADLSQLWVKLDAYESDLPWINYGQPVKFSAAALPGRSLEGKVSLVDPVIDAQRRTATVRVSVPNPEGTLKPGMFVDGVVHAVVGPGGHAHVPGLDGLYVCPMHPEETSPKKGRCSLCGMDLVKASDLGLHAPTTAEGLPLLIPASAALITGTRAVVYVESPRNENSNMRRYEGRDVLLGPRVTEGYVVLEGLEEGEMVVSEGAFRLDAELQIRGKRSMMSPPKKAAPPVELPTLSAEAKQALPLALPHYFALQAALVQGDPAAVSKHAKLLQSSLPAGKNHGLGDAEPSAGRIVKHSDLALQRIEFSKLSESLWPAIKSASLHDISLGSSLFLMHCPMALDNEGARWMQAQAEIRNPYFGEAMLSCGSQVETLTPAMSGHEGH